MRSLPAMLCGVLLLQLGIARADDLYILATADPQKDLLHAYSTQLLLSALEASKVQYGAYRLQISNVAMQHVRQLRELKEGKLVNVSAQVTDPEWEKALIPLRVPIDRGLASFRISLIDERRQAEFARITSLEQLQKFKAGVGEQWALRPVYEENGLQVVPGDNNQGLFAMLMEARFDYLPRSLEEAQHETENLSAQYPHLTSEKTFVLYVPAPRYFFVSPASPRLAERLRAGLEKMIADGSYARAFIAYYAPLIADAGLCKRIVFHLKNSSVGADTPWKRRQLWFDPSRSPDRELACNTGRLNGVKKLADH